MLREFRLRAGLTREVLAERARLSPQALGALERGQRRQPHTRTVRLLADALNLEAADRAALLAAATPRSRAGPQASRLRDEEDPPRPQFGTTDGAPTPDELASFGSQLRHLRVWAGLTRDELAERAGLSVHALGALERGQRRRPYPHTIRALADALNLEPAQRARLLAAASVQVAPSPGSETRGDNRPAGPDIRLPWAPTPLIGRETQIAAISSLLRPPDPSTRLATLTGAAGVGKTRLAVAVARAVGAAFAAGVVFVDLAPLREPRLVAATIARSVGVRESPGRSALELLVEHLRQRQMLLVVDNFEHVLSAASVLTELLANCPAVGLLVTSRSALRVYGEMRVAVPPLTSPPAAGGLTPQKVATYPAVQLFIERAKEVVPEFALNRDNVADVATVCRRLDGMPLALELAAARVQILSPRGLLDQLDRPLSVLTGGARSLPARQQTLRATLDWSHDLLGPRTQVLFRRLAVFAGGCNVQAAQAICAGGELSATDVLDGLETLLDNNLLQRTQVERGEAWLRMLESVNAYADERLVESGELDAIRRQHCMWYVAVAEQLPPVEALEPALDRETTNLRAALDWVHQAEPGSDAELRLATALARRERARGRLTEARACLLTVLTPKMANNSTNHVRALALLGHLATLQGDLDEAERASKDAVALAQTIGDASWTAYALRQLGIALALHGSTTARSVLDAALAMGRRTPDRAQVASVLLQLGSTLGSDDPDTSWQTLNEAVELGRAVGDLSTASLALGFLALLALQRGDYAAASRLSDNASASADQIAYHDGFIVAAQARADLARLQGDRHTARTMYQANIRALWAEGHLTGLCAQLEHLAGFEAEENNFETAARLCGTVHAFCSQRGVLLPPMWSGIWWCPEPAATRRRALAGEPALAAAWAAGTAMSLDEAVEQLAPPEAAEKIEAWTAPRPSSCSL